MKMTSLYGFVCICLSILPFNAGAAIVSTDWKIAGDNLLSHDTVTGLYWLDLTETAGLSRDYVITQFGTGGDFDGFRYATIAEVVGLWSNFGINLGTQTSYSIAGHDPNIITATSYIGNIFCNANCAYYPYGARGMTNDPAGGAGNYRLMGAYHEQPPISTVDRTRYEAFSYASSAIGSAFNGHYLVLTQVPLPASILLFSSGILGLIGISRRKKAA